MADNTLIFFQKLLNNPSATSSQKETICKLRKEYQAPHTAKELFKLKIKEDHTFIQPKNVAQLLSKFDKGKEYGIIIHPDDEDETLFAKSITNIQKRLIEDVQSTTIPSSLKALLFLFVLGKYGTYKKWIGADNTKFDITCSSKIVKDLCQAKHPLHIDETAYEFKEFEKAITINKDIILDVLNDFEHLLSSATENNPTGNKLLSIECSNLEQIYFHTHTRYFVAALSTLLFHIEELTQTFKRKLKINIRYEEQNEICSIIVSHNYKSDDAKGIRIEMGRTISKLELILIGYADITAECTDEKCITYRFSFYR